MTDIILGPLTGVRFWSYQINDPRVRYGNPPRNITSFQWDHVWRASHPTVDNQDAPTLENGHGLNVYKTEADAMRGSADAVNGVLEDLHGFWHQSGSGIVLGTVKFWGQAVEYEFGYAAETVKPTQFLRAWGGQAETIAYELNTLWFSSSPPAATLADRVLIAVQRGHAMTALDVMDALGEDNFARVFGALADLEDNELVRRWHPSFFEKVWHEQCLRAQLSGACLHCHRIDYRSDGACAQRTPRCHSITQRGQELLLDILGGHRGRNR